MDLLPIVLEHEQFMKLMKRVAQRRGFPSSKGPRRNYYYDIRYMMGLKASNLSDYDILYQSVFNRDRHLWLMSASLADKAAKKLENDLVLSKKYSDFEALYDVIKTSIGSMRGIGEVALYDIAVRIGFYLAIYPEKFVYHHSHLRETARRLLGIKRLKSFRTPVADFRHLLPDMPAIILEDILCVMHERICPDSKKYNHLKGTPKHPLAIYGPFSFGKLPVHSSLDLKFFLIP